MMMQPYNLATSGEEANLIFPNFSEEGNGCLHFQVKTSKQKLKVYQVFGVGERLLYNEEGIT